MDRFVINEVLDIVDTVSDQKYEVSLQNRNEICALLNDVSESDTDIEEILLYELSVYKDFTDKVLKILNKYGISNLDKLDRVLFEQRLW